MNLPDELRKLYEDTANKVLAERPDVTLEEVDDRALATVLDRHRKMIAEEMRQLAVRHCGDQSIEGNDAPTAYWLADKIEAGDSDAS